MRLYVVYLGGELVPGRMGEDHEVVVVAAEDAAGARSQAKARWRGNGRAHIDALQRIERIDGYDVILQPGPPGDLIAIDPTYEPADPA
jgi:Domain of Unknown Function (DUF1543)